MLLAPDDAALFAQVGQHNRQFVELVARLRQAELEAMARTNNDNFCALKGRVQMLTEFLQQLRP